MQPRGNVGLIDETRLVRQHCDRDCNKNGTVLRDSGAVTVARWPARVACVAQ